MVKIYGCVPALTIASAVSTACVNGLIWLCASNLNTAIRQIADIQVMVNTPAANVRIAILPAPIHCAVEVNAANGRPIYDKSSARFGDCRAVENDGHFRWSKCKDCRRTGTPSQSRRNLNLRPSFGTRQSFATCCTRPDLCGHQPQKQRLFLH
jgi:hypothetical protein